MTDAQLRSPGASAQQINARIDIGHHPTPEMVSFIPKYEDYEEGYESDGQVESFLDAVVGVYFETAVPTGIQEIQAPQPTSIESAKN